jgi:3-hydroxyacyl-[acyl-carrier-protein] dehydratase
MNRKSILDSMEIRKYIPHRPPFLFVDAIVEMDDKRILGFLTVTANLARGYELRDSTAVMPPLLVLEAISQTAGVVAAYTHDLEGKSFFVVGYDRINITRAPVVGERVFLEARLLRFGGKIARIHGRAYVEQKTILEGEITAGLVDLPQPIRSMK